MSSELVKKIQIISKSLTSISKYSVSLLEDNDQEIYLVMRREMVDYCDNMWSIFKIILSAEGKRNWKM